MQSKIQVLLSTERRQLYLHPSSSTSYSQPSTPNSQISIHYSEDNSNTPYSATLNDQVLSHSSYPDIPSNTLDNTIHTTLKSPPYTTQGTDLLDTAWNNS